MVVTRQEGRCSGKAPRLTAPSLTGALRPVSLQHSKPVVELNRRSCFARVLRTVDVFAECGGEQDECFPCLPLLFTETHASCECGEEQATGRLTEPEAHAMEEGQRDSNVLGNSELLCAIQPDAEICLAWTGASASLKISSLNVVAVCSHVYNLHITPLTTDKLHRCVVGRDALETLSSYGMTRKWLHVACTVGGLAQQHLWGE